MQDLPALLVTKFTFSKFLICYTFAGDFESLKRAANEMAKVVQPKVIPNPEKGNRIFFPGGDSGLKK